MPLILDPKELESLIEKNRAMAKDGQAASYIPELATADTNTLGLSIAPLNGQTVTIGDCGKPFTMQSISKVISLMFVLMESGFEAVFSKVGMEPSGEPFNSISKLEATEDKRPLNPMINAGAIAVASMIQGKNVNDRFNKVVAFIHKITSNKDIDLNERVYQSEIATGDRNRSLAFFMKSLGVIETDVTDALDLYFRLCSIDVKCADLAHIGAFLANNGVIPGTHERLVDAKIVKAVNTIMFTAGMYNESGESAMRTGLPAKSGVSGGILAVVPGIAGIGIIGPAINKKGNSIAGLHLLADLSKRYGWHLFK
ncbi:glutaminase A [Camelliibacillus cellulosilyticus]|uniref:Glutaminase n=1 Tax=Camelliibacillus cellulosilyticus TaxID=2174486 RepID=A0ABV9GJ44_9BACL